MRFAWLLFAAACSSGGAASDEDGLRIPIPIAEGGLHNPVVRDAEVTALPVTNERAFRAIKALRPEQLYVESPLDAGD